MTNNKKYNVFLTTDISFEDYDHENIERYEFTKEELNPDDYNFSFDSFEDWKEEQEKQGEKYATEKEALDQYNEDKKYLFEKWAEDNLNFEELYSVPMMNALRYYPDFIEFNDEDRKKASPNTCLLYDTEREAWAVGMTAGGMDLAPHLLDTFIRLGKGVPIELAESIKKNYSAYVVDDRHLKNCKLLAKAFREKGKQFERQADELL